MQGNSKYLRWSPLYTCCCVFVILSSTVIAVPVRSRRMVRETFSFDATNSNTISNATCFHDGVEVQKSSVTCEIKTGCKLIQKTGECCPDYQCSCNHEDRTYENGEKIVSHNPCRRCVCKGGEVTCNDVSCYIRDDCKPRYVKGVCCPTFDNCPPIDDVKIAATKEAESKTTKNDLIISLSTTTAGSSSTVEKNPMLQLANDNPLGIKIKEITKPEEIRITDDKPKPYNPFKSTTTTTTTSMPSTTTVESTTETMTKLLSTTETMSTSTVVSTSTELARDESSTVDPNPSSGEHESRDYMDDGVSSGDRLSSSEAPPTKASAEGEVEPQLLLVSADSNSIGDDAGNKSVRQTTENSTSGEFDQSSESSSEHFSSTTENSFESSTPFSESPSTERNGGEEIDLVSSTPKNLVVVRHGGKTESFHISGVDELQRVEELDVISSTTENSQEVGESAIKLTNDEFNLSMESIENKSSEELVMNSSSTTTGTPETFDDATVSWKIDRNLENTLNLSDSSTEPNNSIEASTQGFNKSTENSSEILSSAEQVYGTVYYPEEKSSTMSSSSEEAIDTVFYGTTEGPFDASSSTIDSFDAISSDPTLVSTTLAPAAVTVESAGTPKSTTTEYLGTTSRFSYEEEESVPLENPEYPPIPDDLSLMHKDDEEEKRRLPSKVEENISSSTVGPCQECDLDALRNVPPSTRGPPLEDIKLLHKTDIVESRAPGEPHLVPEWERTTTTTEKMEESTTLGPNDLITTANDISKTTIFDKIPVAVTKLNKSEALTQIETLPNDVDSDEKYGKKEPTTERPTTKGYANIDSEEGSAASSAQSEFDNSTAAGSSPKDDAESIKLNSSSSSDENTNDQYSLEAPTLLPNSFQNYFRFLGQNGWQRRK